MSNEPIMNRYVFDLGPQSEHPGRTVLKQLGRILVIASLSLLMVGCSKWGTGAGEDEKEKDQQEQPAENG